MRKLLFVVLLALASLAEAAVFSLPWGPKPQFVDANGAPMSSGTLTFYAAGSTTPQNTYTDATGGTPNSNPITLNVRGETPNEVWLTGGLSYKLVLKDAAGATVWTVDNIAGVNDVTAAIDEWKASALTPTFVSATSFTLVGDQTVEFHKGRRLKSTNSGGTIYSTVVASSFAVTTTVTVANDTGSLDSGLSAVSLGIVRASNPSISPDMIYRKGTAVASSGTGTTDIWSIAGDYVHVTGTNTITSLGTAAYAGDERTVIFDGALILTHNATTLQIPGGASITTAAGDRMQVRADTTANMIVTGYWRASGAAVFATQSANTVLAGPSTGSAALPTFRAVTGFDLPLRSYLAGCTMSTAGSSATMTIAACQATDSTNVQGMTLSSSISKTTSAWTVGTGNGCLDSGAIANNTWYHFYLIMRTDTGVTDILCSTSASAPTMPASYTPKRRIGAGLTNGSAQWVLFSQTGDQFLWSVPVLDVSATNPGTSAVSRTLSVPTGVKVEAIINSEVLSTTVNPAWYLSSLDASDQAPSSTVSPLATQGTLTTNVRQYMHMRILTNTSAQIRSRLDASDGNVVLYIASLGWIDRRGRDD